MEIAIEKKVVSVWDVHFSEFKTKIDKISRRIQKKGIPAFLDYNIIKTENVCVDHSRNKFEILHQIELSFPKIVLPGDWSVIGEITEGETTENGRFNFVNGYGNLQKYVSWDLCDCEHCGTRRHRTHSIILRSNIDNSEKVVGSSCVRDFLGIDPESAIFLLQFLESFESFGRNIADSSSHLYGLVGFFSSVIHSLKVTGWKFISAKTSRENGTSSTAGIACDIFFDNPSNPHYPEYLTDSNSEFYVQTVLELKEKIETLAENLNYDMNEFEQKVAIIGRRGLIDMKTPFQINILTAWAMKHILDKVNPKSDLVSEHFGTVGEKVNLTVIPDRCFVRETQYGIQHIISGLVDGTGNRWTWFGTGNAVERLVDKNGIPIKEPFVISATIKNHDDGKYGKQTILTRVKVI